MAAGMSLVIIAGGIDLSVGVMAGSIGCIGAGMMAYFGWSTPVTIVFMILVGIGLGIAEGFFIAHLKVHAVIVTLSFQMLIRGLVLLFTAGRTVSPINASFLYLGQAYLPGYTGWVGSVIFILLICGNVVNRKLSRRKYGRDSRIFGANEIGSIAVAVVVMSLTVVLECYEGIPVPVVIWLGITGIIALVAEKTTFGRSVYAIKDNPEILRYAGIKIKKNMMLVYLVNGMTVAVAALILTARQGAGIPSTGQYMEFDVIAAVLIGGISIAGGNGRVHMALIGALVIATIDNGTAILNVDTSWGYIIKAAVLLLAVAIDIKSQKRNYERLADRTIKSDTE